MECIEYWKPKSQAAAAELAADTYHLAVAIPLARL
jgi:hypothetical protein